MGHPPRLGAHVWLSLVGPKLEVGTKVGELSVIDRVLAVRGRSFQGLVFGFLDWFGRRSDFLHV